MIKSLEVTSPKHPTPFPPRVHADVAGSNLISVSTLRHIMGANPVRVWKTYLRHRGADGTSSFRQKDVADVTGLRPTQVRGIVNNHLTRVGLYSTDGVVGAVVRSSRPGKPYRCGGTYLPTIRGALVSDDVALVPDDVLAKLANTRRGRKVLASVIPQHGGSDLREFVIPTIAPLGCAGSPSGLEPGVETTPPSPKVGAERATPSGAFALQGGERCAPTVAGTTGRVTARQAAGIAWIEKRCVSSLRVDGGTSFKLRRPRIHLDPQVEAVLLNAATRGQRPRTIALPGLGDEDVITMHVEIVTPHTFVLEVEDRVRVELKLRESEFELTLVARAPELWTRGVASWMNTWLRVATQWLLAEPWTGIEGAHGLGWSVHQLELCSDIMNYGTTSKRIDAFHSASRVWTVRDGQDGRRGNRNLYAGPIRPKGSKSGITLSWHRKDRQLANVRSQSVEASVYADAFLAQPVPYDGKSPLWRIELRAASTRALRLEIPKRGVRVDLTNPAALLDRHALGVFWLMGTRLHYVARGNGPTAEWAGVRALSGLPLDLPKIRYATGRHMSERQKRRRRDQKQLRLWAKEYVASGDPTVRRDAEAFAAFRGLTEYWRERLALGRSAAL